MPEKQLTMTFDPKVIEHLGVRMYSTLPPVLSELIANSYDADAENVNVELHDKDEKKIVVSDDGSGMSRDDIQDKFLVIGRNRREEGNKFTPNKKRKPIGKKGLGKLSFFGIVKMITVDTVKDKKRNVFKMDWKKIIDSKGEYFVDHQVVDQSSTRKDGTIVTLEKIKRRSQFSAKDLASGIARFFIVDKTFKVSVKHNENRKINVENKMRFDLLEPEFEWNFPNGLKGIKHLGYLKKWKIRGNIIASKDPIKPNTNARGVTLFSRRKLVQSPYQFAESTSSHFYSYLSGWLEIDFIDDLSEDVISTNRQSLNWEHPKMSVLHAKLKGCIGQIEREWRKKRKEKKDKEFCRRSGFPLEKWFSSMSEDTKRSATTFFRTIGDISAIGEKDSEKIFDSLLKIVPLYPNYHWRHLHKDLQNELIDFYKNRQYLEAAKDGQQIYQDKVAKKSNVDADGESLFNKVFSEPNPILEIQTPFQKPKTKKNIQKGQQLLSAGMVSSFRNPVSHSTSKDVRKFFNEDDCLDVLSLISFLLRRVDKSKKNYVSKKKSATK
ncbi:TIGR02391 family protein [Candidatus Mycalebacterium sp.]